MTQEPDSSANTHIEDADRPPLGQILVESGLLDARDLERVLEEQRVSGDALGRLLVDGGYVSGPSMALALARQQGTPLKTEYGFGVPQSPVATGEGARLPPALNSSDEPEPEPMPALRTVGVAPIRLAPQPGRPEDEFLPLAEPIAATARPAPVEADAAIRPATEERERALQERIDELTAEQALSFEQTRVDRSRLEELELRLQDAHHQVAADGQALAEAQEAYAAVREAADEREKALQNRIAELTAEFEHQIATASEASAALEQERQRLLAEVSSFAADDQALTEARHDYAALREATAEREKAFQDRIDELTAEQAYSSEQTRGDRARLEELEWQLGESERQAATASEALAVLEQERQRLLAEVSSFAADDQALTEARHDYAALREATEERERALQERIDALTAEQARSSEQAQVERARLEELELLLAEASSSAADDDALAEARQDYAALREATEEREKALQERIDALTAEQARSSEQTRVDRVRLEELEVRLGESAHQVAAASEAMAALEQERQRLLGEASSFAVDAEALAETRAAYAALRQATDEREQTLRQRIEELTAEEARASEQALYDRGRLEELEIRLAATQLHVAPAPDEASDSHRCAEDWHTLFFSTSAGYQLHEAEGPAPSPGAVLNLPDRAGEYRVLRLGPSPLPGDSGRCAYLEELSPARA